MKYVVFILLALLLVGISAQAQDTLKTKYQTKDVIINDKQSNFITKKLLFAESGVYLEEYSKVGTRYRKIDRIKDTIYLLENCSVINHKTLISIPGDSVFQVGKNGSLKYLCNKERFWPFIKAASFNDSTFVFCQSNNPFQTIFLIVGLPKASLKSLVFYNVNQIERYLFRLKVTKERLSEIKYENIRELVGEAELRFSNEFAVKPEYFEVFEREDGFTIVSKNFSKLMHLSKNGDFISEYLISPSSKFKKRDKYLMDPITQQIFVLRTFKMSTQLFRLDSFGKLHLLEEELLSVDNENCGVFNGTFYYLKHEMPYGKSVQSVKLN